MIIIGNPKGSKYEENQIETEEKYYREYVIWGHNEGRIQGKNNMEPFMHKRSISRTTIFNLNRLENLLIELLLSILVPYR